MWTHSLPIFWIPTASFLLGVGVCIEYFCCVPVYLSPFLSFSQNFVKPNKTTC